MIHENSRVLFPTFQAAAVDTTGRPAQPSKDAVTEDVQSQRIDEPLGLNHDFYHVVVAFDLAQDGGKDHQGIRMGDLGELPAHVPDVVLGEALQRIPCGLSRDHFGFDGREWLRSAADEASLFQAGSPPALVELIASVIGQELEDGPQLGGNGGIGRKEGEGRNQKCIEKRKHLLRYRIDARGLQFGHDVGQYRPQETAKITVQNRSGSDATRWNETREKIRNRSN
jgi:hypothetical protein